MRKYITLFLVFSLLWIPGVYAAGSPTPQGLVTDEAGMLSSREKTSIATAAAGDGLTFHVLTVESFNGTASEPYADRVYDSWELTAKDILLVISAGEREVQLNFKNPGLQASLNSWSQGQGGSSGSAALTLLLDTYFIPYAADGDFAGGITSLMKAVRSIDLSQGQGTAGGAQSGSAANPASDTTNPARSNLPVLKIAAILAGAALVAIVAFVLITGQRRRRELAEQQEELGRLLVQANRALESLLPFQGIVQGKTGELVEGISARLSEHLVQISSLQNEGQGKQPAFYQLAALKATIAQLQQTVSSFRSALEEEEQKIAVISEADRNVKQRIAELKQDMPELNEQLKDSVKETGYGLEELSGDLKRLEEETAKADGLELFDPIAAEEVTQEAQKRQEQIEQDLQDVEIYDDKIKAFPGVMSAVRTQIAGIIEQHSLQNMKAKPYEHLEQAGAATETLNAPLRSGDMDVVRNIASRIDLLLDEAVAMTERQALLRQNNRRDLETIRTNWSQLNQRRDGLLNRIAEARTHYVEQHVSNLQTTLEEWSARLQQGTAEVPQIENWTSDERGEYEQARQALDQLLSLQDEAGRQFSSVSEHLDQLNERLTKVTRIFSEGPGRVDAAQQLLHSRGLASRNPFQLALLPEYTELEYKLSARPYNLDELETLGRAYASQISSFVDEASRLIRQKEEQERQAHLAMMREQQQREQARRRLSSGGGFGGGGRSSGGSSWGGGKSGGNSSGGSKW
ncbi:TPM domain-containing protein [Paenibacillus albidus]|uniref:TPM domain-containing protein n=1 Tax=Paenibacillus albidus TaxID=2041023 RepID=UPI001BE996A5|nr:TPM domain-containing protein [Paenibacillus albidus]MBT2289911.1 TPM domain-containing protein [Paenibacillus albidus]